MSYEINNNFNTNVDKNIIVVSEPQHIQLKVEPPPAAGISYIKYMIINLKESTESNFNI